MIRACKQTASITISIHCQTFAFNTLLIILLSASRRPRTNNGVLRLAQSRDRLIVQPEMRLDQLRRCQREPLSITPPLNIFTAHGRMIRRTCLVETDVLEAVRLEDFEEPERRVADVLDVVAYQHRDQLAFGEESKR